VFNRWWFAHRRQLVITGEKCPFRLRTPSFYPLNYGDKWIGAVRFANADCPAASD
jgi:hypothetical protein